MLSSTFHKLSSDPTVKRIPRIMVTLTTNQPLEAALGTILRLPVELRRMIYEFAPIQTNIRFPVTPADMIEPRRDADEISCTRSRILCDLPAVPILQCCHMIRHEAFPIIFRAITVSQNSCYASRHLRCKFRSASFVARYPGCATFPWYVRLELSKKLAVNPDCCVGQCAGIENLRRRYMDFVLRRWTFELRNFPIEDMREIVFDFGSEGDISELPEAEPIAEVLNQQVKEIATRSNGRMKCVVKGAKGLLFETVENAS